MNHSLLDGVELKYVYDSQGVKREVLISYEKFLAILELLEDREDELDVALGKRIAQERQAYKNGEGRSFETFTAETGE